MNKIFLQNEEYVVQKFIITSGLLAVLLGCSPQTSNVENKPQEQVQSEETTSVPTDIADWVLKDAEIVFTSTKTDTMGNDIQEMGNFMQYSGVFAKHGLLKLEINLNSTVTDIAIRDQRIKEWLFETGQFETATITAQLDAEKINQLPLNSSIQLAQPITLDLHGMKADLTANLSITRTQPNVLSVTTTEPVLVNIESFGMTDGLKKLTDVMMLSKINSGIPITFKGNFHRP